MNQHARLSPGGSDHLRTVVKSIFPTRIPTQIERVTEGASTFVYRIIFPHEIFYLRVLPEEGMSFAPEVMAHRMLQEMHARVPEVIYFEPYHHLLQRSVMVTTEIKGQPLSQSPDLPRNEVTEILRQAGRDLASINSLPVAGFGWVERGLSENNTLRAQWPINQAFALEFWHADLAYLADTNVLLPSEVAQLEDTVTHHASWLETDQAYLAHGDFDATHIYQKDGEYTGIIDFGEIRGTDGWYDLGYFHMRDGDLLPQRLETELLQGYAEITALPADYQERICFTSVLINIRAIALSLQKRPANHYTDHQVKKLHEDLANLSEGER